MEFIPPVIVGGLIEAMDPILVACALCEEVFEDGDPYYLQASRTDGLPLDFVVFCRDCAGMKES